MFCWWRHNRLAMTIVARTRDKWYLTRYISILFTAIFTTGRVRNSQFNSSKYILIGVKGGTVITIQYGFDCDGGRIQDRSFYLVTLNDKFLTLHKIEKFTLDRTPHSQERVSVTWLSYWWNFRELCFIVVLCAEFGIFGVPYNTKGMIDAMSSLRLI